MKNRRKASVINSTVAIIGQFLSLLFSFVSRTIFIRVLGEQYLGLNGLFTNLLNILSFAELGIGSAIVFSMYRPLSEHDIPQIKALMFLYKRCYHIIALILMFGGAVILIFLPYLIAGKYDVGNIYIAFLLYLLNSVLSYFWSYKRSIFVANQEGYINSFNQLIFNVVMQSIQIIFLVMYKSYYVYLVIQIVFTVLSNWQISKLANKRYPYLKERVTERVEKKTLSYLKRNVIGMISSKIGGVVVFGTDNLLLSGFIGLAAVGKYSNYTLIIMVLLQ
ncbi:oligosaccharide flippase family protein [Lactiplantibacillus plantarum]|nr:oligosaccharide flippase family protein [Lactiplantibacillus plantarum]WHQ49459.1 oligosaccharide flippase family protein [Lactiplantibacillus plantarum]